MKCHSSIPSGDTPCDHSNTNLSPLSSQHLPRRKRNNSSHRDVPGGTVALRISHLQSLANSSFTNNDVQSPNKQHGEVSRTGFGRRMNPRFAKPASRNTSIVEDSQVDCEHAFLGLTSSRKNHEEAHGIENHGANHKSSGTHPQMKSQGYEQMVQNDATSPRAAISKKSNPSWSSRQARTDQGAESLTERSPSVRSRPARHSLDYPDSSLQETFNAYRQEIRVCRDENVSSESPIVTTSDARRQSVQDTYRNPDVVQPERLLSSGKSSHGADTSGNARRQRYCHMCTWVNNASSEQCWKCGHRLWTKCNDDLSPHPPNRTQPISPENTPLGLGDKRDNAPSALLLSKSKHNTSLPVVDPQRQEALPPLPPSRTRMRVNVKHSPFVMADFQARASSSHSVSRLAAFPTVQTTSKASSRPAVDEEAVSKLQVNDKCESSGSLSTMTEDGGCGTPTCNAAHSEFCPRRHTLSCSQVRHERTNQDCVADISHIDDYHGTSSKPQVQGQHQESVNQSIAAYEQLAASESPFQPSSRGQANANGETTAVPIITPVSCSQSNKSSDQELRSNRTLVLPQEEREKRLPKTKSASVISEAPKPLTPQSWQSSHLDEATPGRWVDDHVRRTSTDVNTDFSADTRQKKMPKHGSFSAYRANANHTNITTHGRSSVSNPNGNTLSRRASSIKTSSMKLPCPVGLKAKPAGPELTRKLQAHQGELRPLKKSHEVGSKSKNGISHQPDVAEPDTKPGQDQKFEQEKFSLSSPKLRSSTTTPQGQPLSEGNSVEEQKPLSLNSITTIPTGHSSRSVSTRKVMQDQLSTSSNAMRSNTTTCPNQSSPDGKSVQDQKQASSSRVIPMRRLHSDESHYQRKQSASAGTAQSSQTIQSPSTQQSQTLQKPLGAHASLTTKTNESASTKKKWKLKLTPQRELNQSFEKNSLAEPEGDGYPYTPSPARQSDMHECIWRRLFLEEQRAKDAARDLAEGIMRECPGGKAGVANVSGSRVGSDVSLGGEDKDVVVGVGKVGSGSRAITLVVHWGE